MTQQLTSQNQKSFLKNDSKLVCSMLVFYSLCILGLIAATFWGLNGRRLALSANATSTAFAVATQQANATITAAAKLAEQDQYEYVERFDKITSRWFVGQYDREYGEASIEIKEGVYVWNIKTPKDYTYGTDFYRGSGIKDFDVYIDAKVVDHSTQGVVCNGFVFRKSSLGWEDGAYVFSVCNDSHYEIYYYQTGKWDIISVSEYNDLIQPRDWNRIAVGARGNHFTFAINNVVVFEMSDDRRKSGSLGIYIQVAEDHSAVLWFDNFGFQSR
jgi:3-keto-disaccharide hydrolase